METVVLPSTTICIFLTLAAVATLLMTPPSAATMADDEKDCAEQMTSLAACIPFVSGSAKQPTKQCCDDTKNVRTTKPKCLCVLIKASSDPSMGLPINTTLALQMPSACNIDAKVSDCPYLLNLPVDSPDAKIFKVASSGDSSSPGGDGASSSDSKKPASPSTPTTSSESSRTTSAVSSSNEGNIAVAGSVLHFLVTGLVFTAAFI